MNKFSRYTTILCLTIVIGLTIYFLVYTSENPSWAKGYWTNWLIEQWQFSEAVAHWLVFSARKTLHFTGYGVLGLLFWLYLSLWRVKRSFWPAIICTAAVASLDEYIQSQSSFRSGKLTDVLLDITGALVLGFLARLIAGNSEKPAKKQP